MPMSGRQHEVHGGQEYGAGGWVDKCHARCCERTKEATVQDRLYQLEKVDLFNLLCVLPDARGGDDV